MNHTLPTTPGFAIHSSGDFVAMLYERRIARNLREGLSICLPCHAIQQPEWEVVKTKLTELLPEGWSAQWGSKKGVLVLTQKPAQPNLTS